MFANIIEQFPDKGTYDTYMEPFGGSYAIGFHTPEDLIVPIEIYNDLYDNVYCLFKTLSNPELFNEFKKLCDLSYYDETMRAKYKEELKSNDLSELMRAYYFFYINRSSHNGVGGFSMNKVIRRNMAKSVSDFLSTVDRLPEIHQRLSKVMILHRDAIELMNEYNEPNVFIYADPPYVLETRSSKERYEIDMTDEQQEKFVDTCINMRAKLLISGYDNQLYRKLEENGFTKTQFTTNKKVETLWKNY